MDFVYGIQDLKTRERGQENCYLITNGLGGFSSASILGSNVRNDHSLFMACVKSPNMRVNLVNRLEERLQVGEKEYSISTQDYSDEEKSKRENGYLYQQLFRFEDYPEWTYLVDGVEVQKKLVMKQEENTIAISYTIDNRSNKESELFLTPYFQFAKKGENMEKEQTIRKEGACIVSGDLKLYSWSNGEVHSYDTCYEEDFFYAYDQCDGRREYGRCAKNHTITIKIGKKEKKQLVLLYSMKELWKSNEVEEQQLLQEVHNLFQEEIQYRKQLVIKSELKEQVAQMLVKSANQFISKRESTGGKTILAGFPFFEDWGRDTMIAMVGCCISTKQFDVAKDIFYTFMEYCKKGIMPNLFPEGDLAPMYNTVDASLLFINAVYLYYEQTNDIAFLEDAYPVMKDILYWYQKGTDHGIHMDMDGLIMAGEGFDQVTWMDVRIGDILPTPRHGKPVEINAYWYSALKSMEHFANILKEDANEYETLAIKVKDSFYKQFWNEEKQCLKDVIGKDRGEKAEDQIRCNQIWAISMPFTMLPMEQEKKVVDTVFEKLYTPCGLRSLEIEDEEFHGFYGGEQKVRDLAYHQGTVWAFPLGAYYLAYLKVNGYSQEAKEVVKRQLLPLENVLREGCVGQIAEIYDGLRPVSSKGCFAQAWSVGELLRVYECLEK